MRIILSILITITAIYSQTISQLVEQSISNHTSLKSIKYRIEATDKRVLKSRNLDNPELSLTINDIQFDDITNRSIEPMQYTALNIKQKIPWFGKLEAREKYQSRKRDLLLNSLESARVQLAKRVAINAYQIEETKEKIDIMKRYINVIKQSINIHNNYNSIEQNHHIQSVNSEIILLDIEIKLEKYKAIQKEQIANLEYLVQRNIKKLDVNIDIKKPKSLKNYISKVEDNREYHIKLSKVDIAKANRDIKELDKYADPFIKVGYFNRADYNDYASVTIGASIPIYGSEKLEAEASQREILAQNSISIDYKNRVVNDIKREYAKLMEAYNIYFIIKDKTLPKIAHLFELSSSSIQSGGDIVYYNQLLSKKLLLEEKIIIIKSYYNQTKAELNALIGRV